MAAFACLLDVMAAARSFRGTKRAPLPAYNVRKPRTASPTKLAEETTTLMPSESKQGYGHSPRHQPVLGKTPACKPDLQEVSSSSSSASRVTRCNLKSTHVVIAQAVVVPRSLRHSLRPKGHSVQQDVFSIVIIAACGL
eukprot:GHUV01040445.1.p1 GENE.GHUV01040445.1~~GHUV01040445.1.p1  ORF type:complete len:139 (+),score=24.73 GHUV01040445.1:221-637(+)